MSGSVVDPNATWIFVVPLYLHEDFNGATVVWRALY